MKVSLSYGLILIMVIAVAFAGCTGQSGSTTATSATTATPGVPAAQVTTAAPAGNTLSGNDIFGTVSYEWTEYKMTSGAGADQMTVYYKYNLKTKKCTMRFEGANVPAGMPTEMDCSSTGSTTSSNDPNEVSSDVKFVRVGTEVVTVPAGTFTADKYTATIEGNTATYWIVRDKPLIKMETTSSQGSAKMELNAWQ